MLSPKNIIRASALNSSWDNYYFDNIAKLNKNHHLEALNQHLLHSPIHKGMNVFKCSKYYCNIGILEVKWSNLQTGVLYTVDNY